jgi:BirA family biotin operon repressor/biotin-[acetyl-CoA-carboxylase] ligase
LAGPVLLWTDRQLAGRGTRGRTWVQPVQASGNDIAMTLALPLEAQWQAEPRLSLLIGAQVARTLELATRLETAVKWPNDLLLRAGTGNWRKAGGILLETLPAPDGRRWLLCGLGLNVNTRAADFPPELQGELTTIADALQRTIERAPLLEALAEGLYGLLSRPAAQPLDLIEEYGRRDRSAGRRYALRREGLFELVEALGVDLATGALRIRLADGGETLVHSYSELEIAT